MCVAQHGNESHDCTFLPPRDNVSQHLRRLTVTFSLLVQLVANAILFVCVNCIGIFHLWMTEHDLRKSNQKREEFSAIRSRKEIKKYQQVK